MKKHRLDNVLLNKKLVQTRSQAENFIRLGEVTVDGKIIKKAGYFVSSEAKIVLTANDRYVSRAGLKLASVAEDFKVDFKGKVVLDVGSSTGGFTDYALQHGALRVIAVDVGTNQLHSSLRFDKRVELHEQTDIRQLKKFSSLPDIVVIDVSFISLREILPHIAKFLPRAEVIAMLKPQFEAGSKYKHKGVIKNERMRRDIIQDFEDWVKKYYLIINKADSKISGTKGNLERFFYLGPLLN